MKRILHFESVDDNCEVFLNGKMLRKHYVWDEAFDVPVDSAWQSGGINSLVLLVENNAGGGGISGSVNLLTAKDEDVPTFARPEFKDAKWSVVRVPHDYLLEGKFTPTADASHGSLPQIPAWYRKTFVVPNSYLGKNITIAFDGVYRNSVIWFNGHKLGRHTSGYIGFRHDLTPFVHYGAPNEISVFVDPRQSEGWWYEGAGIYRHVWLDITNPVHVAPDGTFVTSVIKGSKALLTVETDVSNGTASEQTCTVFTY
jgi:beta-galactosidase